MKREGREKGCVNRAIPNSVVSCWRVALCSRVPHGYSCLGYVLHTVRCERHDWDGRDVFRAACRVRVGTRVLG